MRNSEPFSVRGPRRGPCSICGQSDELTQDHVPPKGATRITAVEMQELHGRYATGPLPRRSEFSQNGVKFRSICRQCNNVRLGADTDPELIKLCKLGDEVLRTPIALSAPLTVEVRPMRVLRSISGHALATETGRRPIGPFEEALARFFLDPDTHLPEQIECFYWPYPYNDQVIIRDVGLGRMGRSGPLIFKLIKFYPLAFMLTWDRRVADFDFTMENLARHRGCTNDDVRSLPIRLSGVPPKQWPEAPLDDCVLMMGGRPMRAIPRT